MQKIIEEFNELKQRRAAIAKEQADILRKIGVAQDHLKAAEDEALRLFGTKDIVQLRQLYKAKEQEVSESIAKLRENFSLVESQIKAAKEILNTTSH